MTLTLAMICRDELENLKRLKPMVQPYVDEWIVVMPPGDPAIRWAKDNDIMTVVKDFTQPIEPEIHEQINDMGIDVDPDARLFNFAAARNKSFDYADGDYIMWLDADDTPVNMVELKGIIEENPELDMFDFVYDYARDEQGNSISDQIRERVIRNNGNFEWRGGELGLIHETIVPVDYRPKRKTFPKEQFFVRHQSDHQDSSSDRNFLALLYEYLKTNGKDPRTSYYLGVELFNHKMYEQCIGIMQEYVKVGGWDEERYRAYIRMAESYHQIGEYESSRNAYLSAVKELPQYPDAYMGIGESYFAEQKYEKAIEFIMTGLSKPVPDTKSAVDMVKYKFRPMPFLALSYLNVGKPQEAYEWYQRAKKTNPDHPWVKEYESVFDEANTISNFIKSFVTLGQTARTHYPEVLPKLVDVIPTELQDQEVLLDFRRRFAASKKWPKNSIVYYCSSAFEDWGPDSLKTGAGGSEEAVIHLTKRWAAMGYDVTVFNNCPEEKEVDGVKWVRFEKFNPRDEFDTLISWRNNVFITAENARVKLADVHDVPNTQYYTKDSLKDAKVMVKSEYHRSLFPHLEDDNFVIIHNGIETDSLNAEGEKINNRLVWTSSYDRGLEHLLEMWPDLKEAVPDVSLEVYYGFNLIDSSDFGKSREGKRWKENMLEMLGQEGVIHHGRVGSEEVAEAYERADVWAYPTDFPEIDCITATKAMAAGCVPITTDYAVMEERNQGVMIKGDIKSQSTKDEFLKKLISLLKDDKKKAEIRNKIDVKRFDWDKIAKSWSDVFEAR